MVEEVETTEEPDEISSDTREVKQDSLDETEESRLRFTKRQAEGTKVIGGVTFIFKALDTNLRVHVSRTNTKNYTIDNLGFNMDTARFGITDIKGLVDEDKVKVEPVFRKIRVAGEQHDYLASETVSGLPLEVLVEIAMEIDKITPLWESEKKS